MSTTIVNPDNTVPNPPTTLDHVLEMLATASEVAKLITAGVAPEATPIIALEEKLFSMVQSGVKAYESQVGKPLDLSLLHQIEPLA